MPGGPEGPRGFVHGGEYSMGRGLRQANRAAALSSSEHQIPAGVPRKLSAGIVSAGQHSQLTFGIAGRFASQYPSMA